jgi:hypothetical protein
MGNLRSICILMVIIPVLISCGVNAEPSGPPGMFYRTYVDKTLGFSMDVPIFWIEDAGNVPPDRSDTDISDPFSQSVISIDCVWTRNDSYPYFYGRNWPAGYTPDTSAELSTVNDGLLSLAGKRYHDGIANYYLYNETRFPGKGDSKFEYAVTAFVPHPGLEVIDNEKLMEQALGSVRIFDPGKPQPATLIRLPLYPGMIDLDLLKVQPTEPELNASRNE